MVMTTNNGNGGSNATIANMKKYVVIKDTVLDSETVYVGDVVEIVESVGNELVYYGKVEEYNGKGSKKSDRSEGLKSSETKPMKTRANK